MYIADRLRKLREAKHLTQGDIERRTGLLRCYISRVENGATIPSVETLQKIAYAPEMPLYQFFYEEPVTPAFPPWYLPNGEKDWSSRRAGHNYLVKLTHALSTMSEKNRAILMATTIQMVRHAHHRATNCAGNTLW